MIFFIHLANDDLGADDITQKDGTQVGLAAAARQLPHPVSDKRLIEPICHLVRLSSTVKLGWF